MCLSGRMWEFVVCTSPHCSRWAAANKAGESADRIEGYIRHSGCGLAFRHSQTCHIGSAGEEPLKELRSARGAADVPSLPHCGSHARSKSCYALLRNARAFCTTRQRKVGGGARQRPSLSEKAERRRPQPFSSSSDAWPIAHSRHTAPGGEDTSREHETHTPQPNKAHFVPASSQQHSGARTAFPHSPA